MCVLFKRDAQTKPFIFRQQRPVLGQSCRQRSGRTTTKQTRCVPFTICTKIPEASIICGIWVKRLTLIWVANPLRICIGLCVVWKRKDMDFYARAQHNMDYECLIVCEYWQNITEKLSHIRDSCICVTWSIKNICSACCKFIIVNLNLFFW